MAKARNGRPVDDDEVEEVPPSESEEQGGEEEEEEYEIEAILDAKQDAFEGGKLGYLVKWKGYPAESNSWVSEDDAINCQDLIDAYWNEQNKKHGQKKAAPASAAPRKPQASAATPKTNSTAASRKRTTPEEEPESVSAPPKKRGRPAKAAKTASESEDDAPVSKAPAKRGRPSQAATHAKGADAMDEDEPEYFDLYKVAKYKDMDSWEPIIDHIDTVERRDDGKLIVYFKLTKKHGSKLCREESSLCRKKFANLLLDFYEHNLRWRPYSD